MEEKDKHRKGLLVRFEKQKYRDNAPLHDALIKAASEDHRTINSQIMFFIEDGLERRARRKKMVEDFYTPREPEEETSPEEEFQKMWDEEESDDEPKMISLDEAGIET